MYTTPHTHWTLGVREPQNRYTESSKVGHERPPGHTDVTHCHIRVQSVFTPSAVENTTKTAFFVCSLLLDLQNIQV